MKDISARTSLRAWFMDLVHLTVFGVFVYVLLKAHHILTIQ